MDAARIRILRELGDRGSVAAVARALHVTPSAISQQLAALQREFAVPLTARSGRALTLTPAGEALATGSAKVESALAEAAEAVAGYLASRDRTVRLGGLPSVLLAMMPGLLTVGADEGATLQLRISDLDRAVSDFPSLTADHDLVIAHRLPSAAEWPDRVAVAPLFEEPLDVVLPSGHPLAAGPTVRAPDLRGERWVVAHADFPLAGVVHHLAIFIGESPQVAHEINDFPLLAEAIRNGAGIGMLPRFTSRPLLTGGLVLRPLEGMRLARRVDVLARPESLARAAVRDVLQRLRSLAGDIEREGSAPTR
jgi:DNA-binding transcriptional LysR family regulator